MTKDEFIKEANRCGYAEEDIEEMVAMVEEARNDGVPMEFDSIVLIEQPVY